MECFCGHGREVRTPMIPVNLLGASFAPDFLETLELKESCDAAGVELEGFDEFVEEGRESARQIQAMVHGDQALDTDAIHEAKAWLKAAKKNRKTLKKALKQI
jgi:hypothetical protein